jgi:predicted YcjX-like family ATPase
MAMTKKTVVDFDELYPGRFIKVGDLKGRDVNMTITAVHLEELEGTKKQDKGVLTFQETPKQLVLNRTNGECIKAMFGRRIADWVGKRITIYPQKIESELADLAVRVRGSPDLSADLKFTLALARKRPREMTMQKTKSAKSDVAARGPAPDEDKPLDDVPGYGGEPEPGADG